MFDSHLWIYVLAVCIAGGVLLAIGRSSAWQIHSTTTDTYWRRRRWYGWEIRRMTDAELTAHFEAQMDELRRAGGVFEPPANEGSRR